MGKIHLTQRLPHQDREIYAWNKASNRVRVHSRRRQFCHDRTDELHSLVSTDSGSFITSGYGMGYPPKIFTSPNYVESDTDIETIPPHIPNLDEYFQTCISKKTRCICKPLLDWDADLIDIIQPESPNKNERDDRQGHPLPSDWSDQENFWKRKTYGKVRPTSLQPLQMPSPKHVSEESNWNENLYPHKYQAKVESQVPIRQQPPGWPNWRNKISMAAKNKSLNTSDNAENTSDKMLQTTKSQEKGHEKIQVDDTLSISKEAFEAIE